MKAIEKVGMSNDVEEEPQVYFFDTYAFFEIIEGNPNYLPYQNSIIITTIFNLAELNYNLKKCMPQEKADYITSQYKDFVVEISFEDIKEAMNLKIKYKHLSIPDVIGYIIARRSEVKFLTGDEGFRNFPNVEFVKK